MMTLKGVVFTKRRAYLIEHLDVENTTLGECLLEKDLLTKEQLESILSHTTNMKRNRDLISILTKRYSEDDDVSLFMEALNQSNHVHVANHLSELGSIIISATVSGIKRKRDEKDEETEIEKKKKIIENQLLDMIIESLSRPSDLEKKCKTVKTIITMKGEIREAFIGESIDLAIKFVSSVHLQQFKDNISKLERAMKRDVISLSGFEDYDLFQIKIDLHFSEEVIQECMSNLKEKNGTEVENMFQFIEDQISLESEENNSEDSFVVVPVDPYTLHIAWEGFPKEGTKIEILSHQPDLEWHGLVLKLQSKSNSLIATGLKPNYTYKVKLSSNLRYDELVVLAEATVTMPEFHFMVLSANYDLLITKLDVQPLVKFINESEKMETEEAKDITEAEEKEKQNEKFIKWLQLQNRDIYNLFVKGLFRSEQREISSALADSYLWLSNNYVESAECSSVTSEDEQQMLHRQGIFLQDNVASSQDRVLTYIQNLRKKHPHESSTTASVSKESKDTGYEESTSSARPSDQQHSRMTDNIAVVIYSHQARDDDELDLNLKDVLTVTQQDTTTGWWKGELGGKEGLFPSNCVQLLNLGKAESDTKSRDKTVPARKVVALNDFKAEKEDELTFSKDDIIVVLEEQKGGMMVGYNQGKIGLFPTNAVEDLEPADDDLIVELLEDKWLHIMKEEETGDRATLRSSRWRKEQTWIQPDKVKLIKLSLVKILCCKDLFLFLSKCRNCTIFTCSQVNDDTDTNADLAKNLAILLQKLNQLKKIDIRGTNLGQGWAEIFRSMETPELGILTLWNNNPQGHGKELGHLFTRLPKLKWLNLNRSGLQGGELVEALANLPQHCPLVKGLVVDRHDMSKSGPHFVSVIKNLPSLILLSAGNNKLEASDVLELFRVGSHLEILAINDNNEAEKLDHSVLETVKQCEKLLYLQLSTNQIQPRDLSEVIAVLSQQGAYVLVDAKPIQPLWGNYIAQYNRIRDSALE